MEKFKPLSDDELSEIKKICESASPGPWKSYIEGRDHQSGSSFIMVGEGSSRQQDIELAGATPEDQDFIARARQDIPRLLQEIQHLKQLLMTRSRN